MAAVGMLGVGSWLPRVKFKQAASVSRHCNRAVNGKERKKKAK